MAELHSTLLRRLQQNTWHENMHVLEVSILNSMLSLGDIALRSPGPASEINFPTICASFVQIGSIYI